MDKALSDLNEAIRIDPHLAMAYSNRGAIWNERHELDKAISDFTEAIRLDPHKATSYFNRGIVWRDQSELVKAIDDFTKAIRLDPQFVAAYVDRGAMHNARGELEKAIKDYLAAIDLAPCDERALNNLAWIRATAVDTTIRDGIQAVKHASKACELTDWNRSEVLTTLAAAYAETKDFESAIKWQEKAIELSTLEDKQKLVILLKKYQANMPHRETLDSVQK